MDKIISYDHHGTIVYVMERLKGTHRDNCLCFAGCRAFKPGEPGNCPIAQELFDLCVRHSLTTPVFECPVYRAPEEPADG